MDDILRFFLSLSRKCEKKRMTASGIISAHPLYLFDVHLACKAGGVTENTLYHGTGEFGLVDMSLFTITSTSFNYSWVPPLFYPAGLYLEADAQLECAHFHFLRADR